MAILSLRRRAFRSRHPSRDAETDAARFETIRNAIAMAVADARRERDGLQQRIHTQFAHAAAVLDSSDEYRARDQRDEASIRTAEQNASAACQRVAQLDAQILRLTTLMADLDGPAVPARSPASPEGGAGKTR